MNRKHIQGLMRLMGLEVIYPKRITIRRAPGAQVYRYLLRELRIMADQHFAIDAREEALTRYGTPRIFITYQDCKFTCDGFLCPLEEAGVKVSMDGTSMALANLEGERFWRSLKYQEVSPNDYSELPEVLRQIVACIACYNGLRSHQLLDGLRIPLRGEQL